MLCEDMDISNEGVEDDEHTITMVEDVVSISQISQQSFQPLPVEEEALIIDNDLQAPQDSCGIANVATLNEEPSKKVIDNRETPLLALENSLAKKITNIGDDLKESAVLHERSRYIFSAEKLLELAGSKCRVEIDGHVHNGPLSHETKTASGNLEMFSKCPNGHTKKWVSSEVLAQKRNQSIYLNDSLLPAAIIISGNNYEKFSLLCKALGLNVCLCGDGRNDSPGHSACYCVYTLMEQFTNIVVNFEVIDKQKTGGNSTGMEKEALRRLLERMVTIFPFDELTTDAW